MALRQRNVFTTTLAGFFAWLPIGILFFLLYKVFQIIHPISERLGRPILQEGVVPGWIFVVITCLIIFLFLYLTGRILGASSTLRLSQWLETNLLNRLPGYAYTKGIVTGFIDPERQGAVRAGLIERLPGIKEFVYVIEELPDDQFVVFLPSAPGGATGLVLIVRKDILEFPNISLRDFRDILGFMGSGTKKSLYPAEEK